MIDSVCCVYDRVCYNYAPPVSTLGSTQAAATGGICREMTRKREEIDNSVNSAVQV